MNRLLALGIVVVVLFLFKKPEPPKPSIPAAIIKKVIFGNESSAESASSSDDGAGASADDDGTPQHLPPEQFTATELELQTKLVLLDMEIAELRKENEGLKARPTVFAAPATAPVCATCPQPARSTYSNYYSQGSYYNNSRPVRGIFRRW